MSAPTTTTPDNLLREREAAELLDVAPRWLQDRRADGNGPPFVRLSARAVRYRVRDLLAWLDDNTHMSTAEYGNAP